MNDLEKQFQKDMQYIYNETKEKYRPPTRFMPMINEYGAVGAVKRLISKESELSDTTVDIITDHRWDLFAEYYVLKPEYEDLFTDAEREICGQRLKSFGWDGLFE